MLVRARRWRLRTRGSARCCRRQTNKATIFVAGNAGRRADELTFDRKPRALEAICLKAMARRPEDRYRTAAELADDVERWLDDEPVAVFAEPLRERLYRWSRKHKAAAVSAAACLLCLLLASSAVAIVYQQERAKVEAARKLADDYLRQAGAAEQKAADKEAEANRREEEAKALRADAHDALRQAGEATRLATETTQAIKNLQVEMAGKINEIGALNKKMETAQAELAAAEARAKSETDRANAAAERSAAIEREVIALRREADAYRAQAGKFNQLAALLTTDEPPRETTANSPWLDLTEQDAGSLEALGSGRSPADIVADSERVHDGRQSLRVSTRGGDMYVTYPKTRDADWDLSKYDHLTLSFIVAGEDRAYRDEGLAVRIGRGSQMIEYRAAPALLNSHPKDWASVKIPLSGDELWIKTEKRPLDLAHVDWLEVHVSTAGPDLTVWLDDLRFGADSRHAARMVLPDPDREVAELVVSLGGSCDVWLSGRMVMIRAMSDIPADPFKVTVISLEGSHVTDDALRSFSRLSECHTVAVQGTNITEEGLAHLAPMRRLKNLYVCGNVRLTAVGLKHFANHPTLHRLAIEGPSINDEAMDDVAAIPKLDRVDLGHAPRVTDEGLKRLRSHAPLRELNLGGTKVTEKGLRQMKDVFTELSILEIRTSSVPNGLGFLKGCPLHGVQLDGDSTPDILEKNLESLKQFPGLTRLGTLSATLTQSQAKQVSELAGLTYLIIRGGRLENGGLEHLARLSNLESLYIDQEATISDAELRQLAALKKLKTLELPRAELEARSVIWLQSALPDCKITVSPAVQAAIDAARR